MRSQLVAPLLALVRERGGDPAALARRFELPPGIADQPEVVLPLRTLHALLDAAADAAGDRFLGVHLAQRLPRGAYGVVEYTCRTAPTIRDALGRIVRYVGLLNELVVVSVEERGGAAIVEHRIPGEPLCVGRHGNEFFITMLLSGARTVAAAPCVPSRAWFAHPQPDDVSVLLEALGTTRVRFGAGSNGVELPAEVLDLPLPGHDPALLALLDRQAEQALGGLPAASRLVAQVRRRIRDTLGEEPPTLEGVAAGLAMSPRTLQRRLADDGVRFQALLDEVRRELALDYVRDRRRPLGEIAYLLGYAELSPFLRAFKRWTGKTPADLRDGG
jgi:AraC-like DNA-binding protein